MEIEWGILSIAHNLRNWQPNDCQFFPFSLSIAFSSFLDTPLLPLPVNTLFHDLESRDGFLDIVVEFKKHVETAGLENSFGVIRNVHQF